MCVKAQNVPPKTAAFLCQYKSFSRRLEIGCVFLSQMAVAALDAPHANMKQLSLISILPMASYWHHVRDCRGRLSIRFYAVNHHLVGDSKIRLKLESSCMA